MTPRAATPRPDVLSAEDIDWEDPPRAGRATSAEVLALIDQVKAMVPALRERQDQWAVLEAFDDPKVATARSTRLAREWKDSDAIEARLQFRACKMLEGGSKLYVRLRRAGDVA